MASRPDTTGPEHAKATTSAAGKPGTTVSQDQANPAQPGVSRNPIFGVEGPANGAKPETIPAAVPAEGVLPETASPTAVAKIAAVQPGQANPAAKNGPGSAPDSEGAANAQLSEAGGAAPTDGGDTSGQSLTNLPDQGGNGLESQTTPGATGSQTITSAETDLTPQSTPAESIAAETGDSATPEPTATGSDGSSVASVPEQLPPEGIEPEAAGPNAVTAATEEPAVPIPVPAAPAAAKAQSDTAAPIRLDRVPGRDLAEAARRGGAAATAPGRAQSAAQAGNAQTTEATASQAAKPAAGSQGQDAQAAQTADGLAQRLAAAAAAGRMLDGPLSSSGKAESAFLQAVSSVDGATVPVQQTMASSSVELPGPPSVRAGLPDPGLQLAIQIQRAISANVSRFSIRMEPAELGRIDVRLDFGRDGRVRAMIAVERAETLDLLQKDTQGLERALKDAGADPKQLSLDFSLRGNGGDADSAQANAEDQADQGGDEGLDDPGKTGGGNSAEATHRVDGLVDITV